MKIYFLLSNGDLGSDVLRGFQIMDYLKNYYNVEYLLTDVNFQFDPKILKKILAIENSLIICVRATFVTNPKINLDILKKIKAKHNYIIFDPVDLFCFGDDLKNFIDIHHLIDILICNNIDMATFLQQKIDTNITKTIIIYHNWDNRIKSIKKYSDDLQLGFMGCVKGINLHLLNNKSIIKKYNVMLLDTECGSYVNDQYNNKKYDWKTTLFKFDELVIKFNVQISIRSNEFTLFKTNAKISTSAALDQVIITTKEHANLDLLNDTYPFYLNDTTIEEFERIYNLLINDYNSDKILWNSAKEMLNVVKYKTSLEIIGDQYVKLIADIISKKICKKNNKIAVISANIQKYDNRQTNILNIKNKNLFDWYYFSDDEIKKSDGWNIINSTYHSNNNVGLSKESTDNSSNMLKAKYYKLQSHKIDVLTKYEYIIWIDASIEISNSNFVNDIMSIIRQNISNIYLFEHSQRNNIKDECNSSRRMAKYSDQNMEEQIKHYYDSGFVDSKLYECGFFIYRKNDITIKLFDDWWNEVIKYTFQDQLSFPYVLWKNNIVPHSLNDKTNKNIWNNKLVGLVRKHLK
jgi:hypothetical protein